MKVRVSGDIRRAFAIEELELPAGVEVPDGDVIVDGAFGNAVADFLGLRRFGAEEAISIDDVEVLEE